MSAKKTFLDVGPVDLEAPGGRYSLLAPAFEAMGAMEAIVTPLIGASVEGFDTLEAESKVQIRKF